MLRGSQVCFVALRGAGKTARALSLSSQVWTAEATVYAINLCYHIKFVTQLILVIGNYFYVGR